MKQIGLIQEICRYPLKGAAGESVAQSPVGPDGIRGDRVWALWDIAKKEIQSCKFRPELLLCNASFTGAPESDKIEIHFPDGQSLASDDPNVHLKFSHLVGKASMLKNLREAKSNAFFKRNKENGNEWLEELKATFTRKEGEPMPAFLEDPKAIADYVSLPGTFFLVAPLHIVSTATIDYLKGLHPAADWDLRRFRPNLVVDTGPDTKGLVEQNWIGKKLVIGEVEIACTETAVRCGAVTRPLEELPREASMLRTIVREADQNLGIYGQTSDQSLIRVGDPVYLS